MVQEACQQLAGRELVISDRLHAVILASLLEMPALALDNGTGKVHAFLDTWSSGMPLARAVTPEALPQQLAEAAAGRAAHPLHVERPLKPCLMPPSRPRIQLVDLRQPSGNRLEALRTLHRYRRDSLLTHGRVDFSNRSWFNSNEMFESRGPVSAESGLC